MNKKNLLHFFSLFMAAIAFLANFRDVFDLGVLLRALIDYYSYLRDLIWYPIGMLVTIPPAIRNMATFFFVFVPAFILRGQTYHNVAAISFLGSNALMLLIKILFAAGGSIDWISDFNSWRQEALMVEGASFWLAAIVCILVFILAPFFMLICGVMFGWIYWWLVFLFPNLGVAIQLFARQLNFENFDIVRVHLIYIPYLVGCAILKILGLKDRILVGMDSIVEYEPRYLSLGELKQYYLPMYEILKIFLALILLSKVIFDSVHFPLS